MWWLYLVAALAGVASAVQPGQNTALARALGQPVAAGIVSMVCGFVVVAAFGAVSGRTGLPSAQQAAEAPWWAWFGGALGAGLILAQLFAAHRIGAAAFLGLMVTAGVVTSILLDHFGLVGFDVHPAGLRRLLGGALMIAGVALVALS